MNPPRKRIKINFESSSKVSYVPEESDDDDDGSEIMLPRVDLYEELRDNSSSSEESSLNEGSMTFLDGAMHVLKKKKKFMHYRKICDTMLDENLVNTEGSTPHNTLNACLHQNLKKKNTKLTKKKGGFFGLKKF